MVWARVSGITWVAGARYWIFPTLVPYLHTRIHPSVTLRLLGIQANLIANLDSFTINK